MKDALNYRIKGIAGKSVDSGPEDNDDDAEEVRNEEVQKIMESRPLWEDLKFMLENKPKRKYVLWIY